PEASRTVAGGASDSERQPVSVPIPQTDPGWGRGEIRNGVITGRLVRVPPPGVAEEAGDGESARPKGCKGQNLFPSSSQTAVFNRARKTEIVENSPRPHPGSKSWLATDTGGRSLTLAPPATIRDASGVLSRIRPPAVTSTG